MSRVKKGLGLGGVMILGAAAATAVVATELESRARVPIDRSYSPSAEAMVNRWGFPLSIPAHQQDAHATTIASENEREDRT